jgi:hypothetical protein
MMRICKEIFQNIGCLNSIEAYIPLDENEREREKKKAGKKSRSRRKREEQILYWFSTFFCSIMEIIPHHWRIIFNSSTFCFSS